MKQISRKVLAALALAAMVAVAAGCSKLEDWLDNGDEPNEVHINPEYVAIDWETTEVVSSDDSTGVYQPSTATRWCSTAL